MLFFYSEHRFYLKANEREREREAKSQECQWRKMCTIQQDTINYTISSNKENEIKIKTYERQCAFKNDLWVWSHSNVDWLRTKHR